MTSSKKFPDWWYNDGEENSSFNSIPTESVEEYKPQKIIRAPKSSRLRKSDDRTLKELTDILVEKGALIEKLKRRLKKLKEECRELNSEVLLLRAEGSKLLEENVSLKRVISEIDLDKKIEKPNALYLHESAPQEVVDAVYRVLTKTCHPDVGGSEESMKEINAARDKFYAANNWK